MRSALFSFNFLGIWVIFAAGVPFLGEYWKTWIFANPVFSAKARLSSKSESVSSGNPTIISVVKLASGKYSRIFLVSE